MDAVNNMINRFTRYIQIVKNNQADYKHTDLYEQINHALMASLSNVDNLHQVRDLIKQIQEKLDLENTLLLNLHLMILIYSLAIQHKSKEHLYFASLACTNVIAMYYLMYDHEITSKEVKAKCYEMMVILLSSVSSIEVLKVAEIIINNKINKHDIDTNNDKQNSSNKAVSQLLCKTSDKTVTNINKIQNLGDAKEEKKGNLGCVISLTASFLLLGVLFWYLIVIPYQQKVAKQQTIKNYNNEKSVLASELVNLNKELDALNNQAQKLDETLQNLKEELNSQKSDINYYQSIPIELENMQTQYNNIVQTLEEYDKQQNAFRREFAEFISYCYVTTDTSMCSSNISNPKLKWSEPLTSYEKKFLNDICTQPKYQSYAGMAHCDSYKARVRIESLSQEIKEMRKKIKIAQKKLLLAQQKYDNTKEQYQLIQRQYQDTLLKIKMPIDSRKKIIDKISEIEQNIQNISYQ